MVDNKVKVLGIDPSLSNLGLVSATIDLDTYVVHGESGELITPELLDKKTAKVMRKSADDYRRAKILRSNLVEAIKGHDFAIVEMPIGSQSARAMASYGICIGVMTNVDIPLIQVTPNDVKLVVGDRKTSKAQMIDWATSNHPEIPWKTHKRGGKVVFTNSNEHIADALAAIYAGILTDDFHTFSSFLSSTNK